MRYEITLVATTKVFEREVTDPALQSWSLVVFIFMFASIGLAAISHVLVDKEKATEKGPNGGSWINRLFPMNVNFPYSVLTPLGKKLRIVGYCGTLVGIAIYGIIWKLAE